MSKTRKLLSALLAVSALTVIAPGYAETPTQEGHPNVAQMMYSDASDKLQVLVDTITSPVVNPKELACLARNIFFEAANEPEEGKVAVGLVTLNRSQDSRFAHSVCGVVDQKLVRNVPKDIVIEKRSFWTGTQTETRTMVSKRVICQFSWVCQSVRSPKGEDERWVESQQIARALLANDPAYADYRRKYSNALYFHATAIRPVWAHTKEYIGRIGGHRFYEEKSVNSSF